MLPMSWLNTNEKFEKLKFIGDWLSGEFNFSDLCKRYGISRKTGYKLVNRFNEEGEKAFLPRSHAPHTNAHSTPYEMQKYLVTLKQRYPHWGPEKLRDWLTLNEPNKAFPASSTIGRVRHTTGHRGGSAGAGRCRGPPHPPAASAASPRGEPGGAAGRPRG